MIGPANRGSTAQPGRRPRSLEGELGGSVLGLRVLDHRGTRAGELAALTGQNNPYPDAKLGVIEEGAYADILLVDGNPLEDMAAIGAVPGSFDALRHSDDVEPIRLIMKDGQIYKNTL